MGRVVLAVAAGSLITIVLMTGLFAGFAVTDPDAYSGETLPPGTISAVLVWGLVAGAIGGAVTARLTVGPYRGPLVTLILLMAVMGTVASIATGYPQCWYRIALVLVQTTGAWFAGRRVLTRTAG